MEFVWDKKKNEINIRERGVDFADAYLMFQHPILIKQDTRKDYAEIRYSGLGFIHNRLMVVIFTKRKPDIIRIISLRKANQREQKKFKASIQNRLETH